LIIYVGMMIMPFVIHFLCGKNKKIEVIVDSLIFIAFVGLRAEVVGSDTLRYIIHFEEIATMSFKVMIQKAIIHESPLYVVVAWIVSRISVRVPLYFCIVALIHYWMLGRLMIKYSINVPFSYLIYTCLFLTIQLSGIKNTLATAFIFLAIDMAIEKKLGKFLLSVFVAALFHRTSAVILIIYLLINQKNRYKVGKIAIGGVYATILFIAYIFRFQISNIFKTIGGYTEYGIYEATPISMMILCIAVVLLGLFSSDAEREFRAELLICSLASLFMPLVFVNPSALRVVRYFLCMSIFLIPKSIRKLDQKLQIKNINIMISIFFALILGWQFLGTLSAESVYQYSFFWE